MMIPLLDLKAQYLSIKDEIDAAIQEVMASGQYILGENVEALEKEIAEYCGVKYGIGVANGTDALVLTLDAFGIGKGDEVIATPYTFFATAEAISRVGATPVFVDINPYTYNIDVTKLKEKITEKTKAIIPVHIFGQMADMDPIMEIAKLHNLVVIEDACQAIGAEYKGRKAGSIGHAACFSFFPTKNLGCYGDGGMVVTNNPELALRIKLLRTHGSQKKYHHQIIGYNSRLDELQAAFLRVKLRHLDEWNTLRREKAHYYDQLFSKSQIGTPFVAEWADSVFHLYLIRSTYREKIQVALNENGISTAVYYPVPLHLQPVYQILGYHEGDLPCAEEASRETLAIPLYPEISPAQQMKIAEIIKSVEIARD
ncbi:aminotransferase class V-fold PLP-dependent enzyme [Thermanaerosceptrum fracticalcis]|uniref:Aminotransferase class V-fold PLP-dependent enzyme n=1 Tax=Thermanaerosceptrum fracticalcis TaxID=1712410 RepID=A0A7G6E8L0_THEFR|nr:DegT/DnrJ/EryC1/StrS family aminotransferase [Thermanaerosceptrum fracticalcis]QNB48414.1 aminotransferase class V-fold PLP-dependent enzyme [Thermanaerosceptrum fracticalcis]